jgi:REP element-mobilizing transposase RayT
MSENPKNHPHHRRSIRLPGYDYSSEGSYSVTIVTYNREHLFGKIVDGEIQYSDAGKIVLDVWHSLPDRYPEIEVEFAVVMPNHFHAIIDIVGAIHELPLQKKLPLHKELPLSNELSLTSDRSPRRRMLLPLVIGYFKMNTAKQINILRKSPGTPVWQRNYYEQIITSDFEYEQIADYILFNPQNWQNDTEYC